MRPSNVKVEQINSSYNVIEDYGEILSPLELRSIISRYFPNIRFDGSVAYGSINNHNYCLYFKNVSYLGIPHPHYKKRIQIGDNFKSIFVENNAKNITTILLGVYSYKGTIAFVDFDTERYAGAKAHNSSAHVYTIDLLNGVKRGIFQKTDAFGNIITVYNPENVEKFLSSKFDNNIDLRYNFIDCLDRFFTNIEKNWNGINCYNEMEAADFPNKNQPEWPGFYLEYRLEKFILENSIQDRIRCSQNKKKDDIDLDLYLSQVGCFGDLKAHSNDSNGIQGNDWDTVMRVIEDSSIYYIVCEHDTVKDKDCGFEVTQFWNSKLGKSNPMSYSNRMKNSVVLTGYKILEINKYNKQYLSKFKQGRNSNGDERAPKIMIKSKDVNNFLIHQMNF